MRFDVVEAGAELYADGSQRGDLDVSVEPARRMERFVHHAGLGFEDIGPAEAGAVGIGRMGADGDTIRKASSTLRRMVSGSPA